MENRSLYQDMAMCVTLLLSSELLEEAPIYHVFIKATSVIFVGYM